MDFPIFSLLVLLLIPVVFNVLVRGGMVLFAGKQWPPLKPYVTELLISFAINGVIGLGIGFVMKSTGFFEGNFFRPSTRDFGEMAKLPHPPESHKIISNGRELDAVLISPESGMPKGLVIHFHGSDRNISYTVVNSAWLTEYQFAVLAFDYSGFGKSSDSPTMMNLIEDSQNVIQYAAQLEGYQSVPLILYGQSMGGQLAITAAAKENLKDAVIISEATYANPKVHTANKMGQMGPIWLFKWVGYTMTPSWPKAEDSIKELPAENIILAHSKADKGVLYHHGERLFQRTEGKAHFINPEKPGHLRIFTTPEMKSALVEAINARIPATPDKAEKDQ